MSKNRATRNQFLQGKRVSVIVLVLIGVGLVSYLMSGKSTDINVVGTGDESVLSGTFFKQTPVGLAGGYYLMQEDNTLVKIETTEILDHLIGQKVTVIGTVKAATPTEEGTIFPISLKKQL